MPIIMISLFLTIILIVSMIYEPRNVWNAILLLIDLGFFVLGLGVSSKIGAMIFTVLLLSTPIVFICIASFLIANGFKMMKKEGRQLHNILSLLTGVAMIVGGILTIVGTYYFQEESVIRSLFFFVVFMEFYLSFTCIAFFCYSILYTCLPKRINCDYIIVHGCGLLDGERVSPLLKGRIDKAVTIYQKCKEKPMLVVSGGRGKDEKIAEAEAMKRYLIETGFPEEKIIVEDQSKTTFENLKNIRDMLDVNGIKHHYLFVTNNYHVFRTGMFAKKLRMKANGVGCHTAAYYWPSAFLREYIAVMMKYKWVTVIVIALWGVMEYLVHR